MLPKYLQYKPIKPKGFSQQYKKLWINPQMMYQDFKTNELVRFKIQENQGFVDPYTIYFDVTIEMAPEAIHPTLGGGMQLDGLSTSLFDQVIISQNNVELERIIEYDQLGKILKDCMMHPGSVANKSYEGGLYDREWSGETQSRSVIYSTESTGANLTFCTMHEHPLAQIPQQSSPSVLGNQWGVFLKSNIYSTQPQNVQPSDIMTTIPIGNILPVADQQVTMSSEYGVQHAQGITIQSSSSTTNEPQSRGYYLPKGRGVSQGNLTSQIQPTANCLKLINGKLDRQFTGYKNAVGSDKWKITQQRYFVPLLSGFMGQLIPQSEYKLIPLASIVNTELEIRLNQYAFFMTQLYNEPDSFSSTQKATQAPRAWKIKNIQLNMDVWYYDQAITSQINSALAGEGLTLSSCTFSMGPQYQIAQGNQLENTWQLTNSIESINMLLFWFLSNDYLKYTFCRKHFRLSMNITQYQLKAGSEFIPQWPIKGHAGNIALNSVITQDNTEFIQNLHKMCGLFFNPDREFLIDKLAFAVNDRCYSPEAADLAYNDVNKNVIMCNTFRGMTSYHENRYVGKALYGIIMDNNPYDPEVISGFNSKDKRPLELIIKCDQQNYYERPATMYTAYYHDFIVVFKNGSVQTFGQG